MWSENIRISLTIIVVITIQSSAEGQLGNSNEYQENDTIQNSVGNILEFLSNASNIINSPQISFENMLANNMKNFIPYSNENENCKQDGLRYMTGLQDQSSWAIQSK